MACKIFRLSSSLNGQQSLNIAISLQKAVEFHGFQVKFIGIYSQINILEGFLDSL